MPLHPLFTIIVSGYQNEPFLPQCLASISGQTFGNFEAICYVEESTDNSLAICQEWAKRDARFIVATGPKSGSVSATRNFGIDHAQGEYLVVVDGDDWIVTDMLEKLAGRLDQTGPLDVLAFAAAYYPTGGAISNFRKTDSTSVQVFAGLEAIRRFVLKDSFILNCQTWLNIYRLSFLRENNLRFIEKMACQDLECFPRIFFAAQRVAYIDECFYFYRSNPNSMQNGQRSKCLYDLAYHFQHLVLFLSTHSVPSEIQAIWSNQWLVHFFSQIFLWHRTSDIELKATLKIFFATKPKTFFWRFLLRSAWHRVLALPLLWLARNGFHSPANLYFHKIYPKLDWRFRHSSLKP